MSASGASIHQHPAWFGAVMGTGALALVAASQSDTWLGGNSTSWLDWVAVAFLLLATAAALLLWPRYLRRLADRGKLAAELSDPAHGAMLATFPAGVLVLAVAWGRVGPYLVGDGVALVIDTILLVIGAALATVTSAWWATSIGRSGVGLEGVNGGWLIPPVMNLIVPLAIVPLIVANPQHAAWLVPLALAFWGIGAILFLALLAVLVARLAFRTPLAAPMAPSLWIPLAPAGVLGLSLLRTLEAAAATGVLPDSVVALGIVVSAAGIGFGLWWALFAWFDLTRARREGVPFHPGWWGFVFPIAAMSLSTSAVGLALQARLVEILGTVIAVTVTGVWLLVAVRTVRALATARSVAAK